MGSGFISGRYLENSLTFNSFDVWGAQLPWILVFGILGSLSVPDTFGGPVKVYIPEFKDWRVMPPSTATPSTAAASASQT